MSRERNEKNSSKEKLKELEEERVNNEIYLSWLNNDPELFVKRLARKHANRLAIVSVPKIIARTDKQMAKELKEWFKFPYHRNSVCNIYLIVKKYYEVEDEHLMGFITWLYDKYEHQAWEMWYDNYKDKVTNKKYKLKYTPEQAKKILKAHGWKEMHRVKVDTDHCYIYWSPLKMIYPHPFKANINSLDVKNPGVYFAGKMYGLPGYTSCYVAPNYGQTEVQNSTARFLKKNTIED